MTEAMAVYGMVFAKLAIGLLAIILQINLMGKGNLAPTSALDQLQNYVLGGIIGAIIPGLDMISFGPTLRSPHSPDERALIPTVRKFYDFLVATLEQTPLK